jgi:hypothetical protein
VPGTTGVASGCIVAAVPNASGGGTEPTVMTISKGVAICPHGKPRAVKHALTAS